jgi:hypothetical protein
MNKEIPLKNIAHRFGSIIGRSLVGGIFVAGTLWPLLFVLPTLPSDFQIYLDATRKFFRGGNPYQPFLIGASFIYPPTALLLFAPFSWLSDGAAIFLFRAVNALSYLSALLILVRITRPKLKKVQLVGIIFVFMIFAPFVETLVIGQANGLILLGIVVFVYGIIDSRFRWIGDFGLAFVIAVKISPLLLLAYPFLRGDWKRILRVGICLLVLVLLALLFFGIQPWMQFAEVFPALFSSPSSHALTSLMDWGVYESPLMGLEIPGLKSIFTVILLAVWVGAILRYRRKTSVVDIYYLGVVTMTIASSLVWFHHFVFLVFPIFYLMLPNELQPWHKTIANLTVIAFLCIQSDRMVTQIIHMPLSAMFGYLLLYVLALINVFYIASEHSFPLGNKQGATRLDL